MLLHQLSLLGVEDVRRSMGCKLLELLLKLLLAVVEAVAEDEDEGAVPIVALLEDPLAGLGRELLLMLLHRKLLMKTSRRNLNSFNQK